MKSILDTIAGLIANGWNVHFSFQGSFINCAFGVALGRIFWAFMLALNVHWLLDDFHSPGFWTVYVPAFCAGLAFLNLITFPVRPQADDTEAE